MIKKTIEIDGKEITFKMSGATALVYRAQFGEDLILQVQKDSGKSFESTEKLAWVCAGCPGKSVEKWLEQFTLYGLTEIYAVIEEMIVGNLRTTEGNEKANKGEGKNAMKEEG